ncbi:hypothetical protein [Piscinibacter sp. XHJ-5]|uniref:hypothetical protein n=1 Tax=Piscinibacter sp. XHJ-5 TaxID=3037797 RepID=UPI002452A50E|nr:hypothetical protein [Piscinibacter sp. XHJ-5]
MTAIRPLAAAAALLLASALSFAEDVVVNAVPLDAATRSALERAYGVPLVPGRYWYDTVSGVWGREGGPAARQIHPGLRLGGPLRRDASRGRSGVVVNGRELHALDVAALQRCTAVIPGRYWVLANGVGGPENGPAQFNLAVLCGRSSGGAASNTRCDHYGGGQFNCSNSRTGIGMIGEGGGKGAVFVDGKVLMTPN